MKPSDVLKLPPGTCAMLRAEPTGRMEYLRVLRRSGRHLECETSDGLTTTISPYLGRFEAFPGGFAVETEATPIRPAVRLAYILDGAAWRRAGFSPSR